MVEAPITRVWLGVVSYLGIGFAVLVLRMLPLGTEPIAVPFPDIFISVTLAWVTRRPDLVPFFAIAILFFAADLLLMRPPGLYSAVVLIATDILRRQTDGMRNLPFILEWMVIAATLVAITVGYRAILFVTFTPMAPLGLTLLQLVMTAAFYPLVAGILQVALGLRKPARGEVDTRGKPL